MYGVFNIGGVIWNFVSLIAAERSPLCGFVFYELFLMKVFLSNAGGCGSFQWGRVGEL